VVQKLGQTHYLISPGGTALGIGGYTDTAHRFGSFEAWMMRLHDDPEGIAAEEVARLQGYRQQARLLAQHGLDAVRLSPDYGHGRATYCSPDLFRRAFFPGLAGLCAEIHAAGLAVLFHCDANMHQLMELMVEAGADMYQSIEPHEPMDQYKRQVGDRLTLWGNISCHDLCTATPDVIRRQARLAIRHCGPGGGFILGSSHNIMTATRYDNFMAMLDAAFTEGRYPLA
jgi:uroporphyrinogen decarboxylase